MDFWKINGAGNDFIVLNNMTGALSEDIYPRLALRICERHLSIGADGLMVVCPPTCGGDFRMLFYNSDGSLGEMCGNGARCICRYGYENGLSGEIQRVETTAGMVMGFRIDTSNYRVRLNDPSVVDLHRPVAVEGREYDCAYVELGDPGVPHCVLHIPELSARDENELFRLGRALRYASAFHKGANVNFYDFLPDGKVLIKTYERGVEDFTYACGTGTGSVAIVLALLEKITGDSVTALMRGGTLKADIEFSKNRIVKNLWLTGPTNIVAKGIITDENLPDELLSGKKEMEVSI